MTIEKHLSSPVSERVENNTVNILLNSESRQVHQNSSLYTLVKQEKLTDKGVVIAINNQIIPHHQWEQKLVVEGDNISIFQAIAGG